MADVDADEFAADASRFVDDLNDGAPIAVALDAANDVVHHPDVIAAGTAMLANGGTIDMKQLAADAGMSRASLYRYYPDKVKVEAEIAGTGNEGMVAANVPSPKSSAPRPNILSTTPATKTHSGATSLSAPRCFVSGSDRPGQL
jgi:DNA-binding phage protein